MRTIEKNEIDKINEELNKSIVGFDLVNALNIVNDSFEFAYSDYELINNPDSDIPNELVFKYTPLSLKTDNFEITVNLPSDKPEIISDEIYLSTIVSEIKTSINRIILSNVYELADINKESNPEYKKYDINVDDIIGGKLNVEKIILQRNVLSKILMSVNLIAMGGRIGPAEYIITNSRIGEIIKKLPGFEPNENETTKILTDIYTIGKLTNLTIYIDPYLKWSDNKIYLGRQNDSTQQGITFFNHRLLDSIKSDDKTITSTSSFLIEHIGNQAEKQYICIEYTDTKNILQ